MNGPAPSVGGGSSQLPPALEPTTVTGCTRRLSALAEGASRQADDGFIPSSSFGHAHAGRSRPRPLGPAPLPRGLTGESDAPTLRDTQLYRGRQGYDGRLPPIQRAVCGHPRWLHGGRLHRASGVLSVPARQHQAISLFLFLALYFFVRDIGGKLREPDLLLVTDAEGHRCRNDHRVGAGLVVEVMSPRQCRPRPHRQAHGLRRGRHPRVLVNVKRSLDIPRLGSAENMEADTNTRSDTGTAYCLALPTKNCPISSK